MQKSNEGSESDLQIYLGFTSSAKGRMTATAIFMPGRIPHSSRN